MKKIDDLHLGPRAKYQWQEMRKRRYNIRHPAKVEYMLLPYFWLPHGDRIRIIQEEMNAGRDGWKDVQIKINGKETTTRTYGELGALTLGGRIVLLDAPFVELTSIDIPSEAATT
jgi:hypothetical protein